MGRRLNELKAQVSKVLAFTLVFTQIASSCSISAFAEVFSRDNEMLASSSNAIKNGSIIVLNEEQPDVEIMVSSDVPRYEAGDMLCLDVYVKNNTNELITDGRLKFSGKGVLKDTSYFEMEDKKYLTNEEMDIDIQDMEYISEDGRIEGFILEPNSLYHFHFYCDIDEETEGIKDRNINFTFTGKAEKKKVFARDIFYYTLEGMNLSQIEDIDDTYAGDMISVLLSYDLGVKLEDLIEDAKIEDLLAKEEESVTTNEVKDTEVEVEESGTDEGNIEESKEDDLEGTSSIEELEVVEESDESKEDDIQDTEKDEVTSDNIEEDVLKDEEKETTNETLSISVEDVVLSYMDISLEDDSNEKNTTDIVKENDKDLVNSVYENTQEGLVDVFAKETQEEYTENIKTEFQDEIIENINKEVQDSIEEEIQEETQENYIESIKTEIQDESIETIDKELEDKPTDSVNEETQEEAKDNVEDTAVIADNKISEIATPSNAYVKWEGEDIQAGEKPIIKDIKVQLVSSGLEITDVYYKALSDTEVDIDFEISDEVVTGLYFAKFITTYSYKNRTYHSSQGFMINVLGEEVLDTDEEITLTTEFNGAEISVTGPRSSFPEGDELELSVMEVTAEQSEMVAEALDKKSEELELSVGSMKALDIKVLADGEYKELQGDVKVVFKELTLDSMYTTIDLSEDNIEILSLIDEDVNSEEEVLEVNTEITELTEVLHLDEEEVELNAMEVILDEEGNLQMETNHFSVFIVVNFEALAKSVKLEITHYGYEKDLIYDTDIFTHETDLQVTSSDNGLIAKPGAAFINNVGEYEYNTKETKLYSDDVILLNGWQTKGVPFEVLVNKISKVELGGNYRLCEFILSTVLDGETVISNVKLFEDGTYEYSGDGIILGEDGNLYLNLGGLENNHIKMMYEPTIDENVFTDVDFHDYNVTIRRFPLSGKNVSTTPNINDFNWEGVNSTKRRTVSSHHIGMNDPTLQNGSLGNTKSYNKLHVGIPGENGWSQIRYTTYKSTGDYGDPNIEGGRIRDITKDTLDENGNLRFNYDDPGLFIKKDILGKETYAPVVDTKALTTTSSKQKSVTYYSKKYLTDYKLKFTREGNNYTLTSVITPEGVDMYANKPLDLLYYTQTWWKDKKTPLYSNLFWPMDSATDKVYGTYFVDRDPLFPQKGFAHNDDDKNKGTVMQWAAPETQHNWYFGMDFEVDFDIRDYAGPLDYYFRGDDDLWVYVDGVKVEDLDIGGLHSSIGAYVDLKEWMKEKGMITERTDGSLMPIDKDGNILEDKTFKLVVYYMERGGQGSTCYMSYTLPKVKPVEFNTPITYKYEFEKEWNDDNDSHHTRPDSIGIQLYRDGEVFGDIIELDESYYNEETGYWEYTWNGLEPGYEYSVEEIYSSEDYIADYTYINGITHVTNTYACDVTASKKWANTLMKHPVYFALYAEAEGEECLIPDSIVCLDGTEEEPWTYTWEKVRQFDVDGNKIHYQVYEVEVDTEEYEAVEDNEVISAERLIVTKCYEANDTTEDGNYIVSYDNEHLNVTNTRVTKMKDLTVTKDWVDTDISKRPYWVQVNLYQDGKVFKQVYLSESNNWTYTWSVPVNKSDDTEYEYTITEYFENKDLVDGDIVKFNTKDAYQVSYENISDTEFKVINTYISPITTELEISKLWENTDNLTYPDSIDINIYQNNNLYKKESLTKENDYFVSLEVPLYDENDVAYTYSVYEVVNNKELKEGESIYLTDTDKYKVNYLVSDNLYNIVNTYIEPVEKEITVTKVWEDNGETTRPDSIDVYLYQDNKLYDSVSLNKDNNYEYNWKVPVYFAGSDTIEHVYRILESFNGKDITEGQIVRFNLKDKYQVHYTVDGDITTITNTYIEPLKKIISVEKVWKDNNDTTKRPESIEVVLYQDEKLYDTVSLNELNKYKASWKVDVYDDYTDEIEHVYRIAERLDGKDLIEGETVRFNNKDKYTVSYDTTKENLVKITNTYIEPFKKTISVEKNWLDSDAEDIDKARPESIEVVLYQDGKVYSRRTLDSKNGFKTSWIVDTYDDYTDEIEHVYTVYETYNGKDLLAGDTVKFNGIDKYEVSYEETTAGHIKITNDWVEPSKKELSVIKTWINDRESLRPEVLNVIVYQDGEPYKELNLSAKNGYKEMLRVPVVHPDDEVTEYNYTIAEICNGKIIENGDVISFDGEHMYKAVYDNTNTNNLIITNSYIEPFKTVSVEKVWIDKIGTTRPKDGVLVRLYQDNELYNEVRLNDSNNWYASWEVPEEHKDGTKYKYSVIEMFDGKELKEGSIVKFNGTAPYEVSYTNISKYEFRVINTYRTPSRNGGGGGGGSTTPPSEPPTEVIVEPPTPLGYKPDKVLSEVNKTLLDTLFILDTDVPLESIKLPKTGDDTKRGLWKVLLAFSGFGIFTLLILGKKNRKDEEQ